MSTESIDALMKRFVEFINTADEQLAQQVIASGCGVRRANARRTTARTRRLPGTACAAAQRVSRYSLDVGRDDHRGRQGGRAVHDAGDPPR